MRRPNNQFLKKHRTFFGVIWLISLFLLAFSYAMFEGGFVSWFVFYSFLPVLINSVLILCYPLNDFKVGRILKKHELYGGETLEVTIELTRRLPFPLFYLIVEDHLPASLVLEGKKDKPQPSKGLFSIGFTRFSSFTYRIEDMPRGAHRFLSIELKTGDFFGFIQKKRLVPVEDSILVYPKIVTLNDWFPEDLALGGSHRSKKHFERDLTSISSIRDYKAGDRLSWIDWKATARVNHLVTKEFETQLNRDVIVVFDEFGKRSSETRSDFEMSVMLAASLVDRSIKVGASVGFISIGKKSAFFELTQSGSVKWQIFRHLANVEQNGIGEASYPLIKYLQKLPHQATILYITTQMNKKDLQLFNDISTRGLSVEFYYVDHQPKQEEVSKLLERLDLPNVQPFLINSPEFNQQLKAGGRRATS